MDKQAKAKDQAGEGTALAVRGRSNLMARIGGRYGVEPGKLLECVKATAFKGATNEQLMALMIVSDQYRLNPFLKEIYAFPDQKSGGIVPVVGLDGWARIINDHPQFDGMEFEQDDQSCTCRIFRKDRTHATEATEYLAECRRETGPWKSHPRRMLRHKAMIQCARLAFGFGGIHDPDEAERIIEGRAGPAEPLDRAPFEMPTEAAQEATGDAKAGEAVADA